MRLQSHQLKALREWEALPEPKPAFIMPPPLPKKKRSQEESLMQRALIKWWAANCRHFGVPELALFSIPNGGARSAITGSIMKAEGARKGVPDLMLAVAKFILGVGEGTHHKPAHFNHALFLELKRRDGIVSPEQEAYHSLLRAQGYKVVVVRSLQECINEITTYLT